MHQRKFRIWDHILKKMIYPEIFFDTMKERYGTWSSVELVSALRFYDAIGGKSELMDWTGTKTKNTTDIYEGDRLLLDLHWDISNYTNWLHDKIGMVKFNEDHGGWVVECEYHHKRQYWISLNCDVAFTATIVGHVFGEIKN